MDFELTDEQKMLREAVREFVRRERIRERAAEWDRTATFPRDAWAALAETGWCGMGVPERLGGEGGSVTDLAIAIEELARGDVSLANTFLANQFAGARTLSAHGSPEQQAALLPGLCAGETMFAFGVTEPDGGTDLLTTLRTTAVRDGDDYVLNGSKSFTTGAGYSDHILVLARTSEGRRKSDGLTVLIVPTDAEGLEIQKLPTMSVRASETTQTFYRDVRVPASAVLGEEGRGFYQLLDSLNDERILISAAALGIATQALEESVQFARERRAFGRSIGAFQSLQHGMARAAMQIEATRLLVYRAADLQQRGLPCKAEAAMVKVMASELAWETAFQGTRMMGGHGITTECNMQRYLRDSWPTMNGPLTNEQALNLIGESLGLERSY